jgi:SAM-dependent methyltransferase
MSAEFQNVYDDGARADAYAALEFPGTYYLAYRDLPAIIAEHVSGDRALDFGCGAGRSTRFLSGLGFRVVGVDIAEPMIDRARARDPRGEYRLIAGGDLSALPPGACDLVLSAFTFDNIPGVENRVALMASLGRLLKPAGRIVSLVSSSAIYVNEWASFSTRNFPGNRDARDGDPVRIVMLDVPDRRPVEDILWTDEAYDHQHRSAGLAPIAIHRPLGRPSEPHPWVSETTIAPWVIHVLGRAETNGRRAGS